MDYATTLNIDGQGRIIIPAKLRKLLKLHTGDLLMLEADNQHISLRKCEPYISMDMQLDNFLDILYNHIPCRILLCNESEVLSAKGYHLSVGKPISDDIKKWMQKGEIKLCSQGKPVYPFVSGKYPITAFFPITSKNVCGKSLGLLLCNKNQQSFSEMDLGCAKMTAVAISRYIQQKCERMVI